MGLLTGTVYSANFLIRERTGRNIWQNLSRRQETAIPERPLISTTEQANLHRELHNASSEMQRVGKDASPVTDEVRSQREAWKTQREKEIKDDLDEGKGLSDMIYDQIWDVWNWGKKKNEDDEE